MTLSKDQFAILAAPFASQDHEFKPPRGYVYIAETAICQRIEEIDVSWEWRVETVSRFDPRGAQASVVGHLTICGVTRSGVGMQAVEFQKGTDVESGEAEKGAETDALKRAARKFGIGRYLLDCPKEVKGHGPDLNKWLDSLSRAQPAPQRPESAPVKPAAPAWWGVLKDVKPLMTVGEFDGITAELKAGLLKGSISADMSETNARLMLHEEFGIDVRKKENA